MEVYPLESITVEEAARLQFHIVDCITREFSGRQFLTNGDLGLVPYYHRPVATAQAERVIANIFGAEAAMLVRGAGSAAIRFGLYAVFHKVAGDKAVLIHRAPAYPTTRTSFDMLGLRSIAADFHDRQAIGQVLKAYPEIRAAVIQHSRQKPDDRYDIQEVIDAIRETKEIPILTDDNYAVFKVKRIGVQCGADLSCFSAFKLLGPEGIGVIVGRRQYLDILSGGSYSGGMQTQGHEALEVLRGFVYAPVSLALQAAVNDECAERLNRGEVRRVKHVCVANAQSKVLLVEFDGPIAEQVLTAAEKLGAAPYPVGSESKYEIAPMFYRVSGTFSAYESTLAERMIRINPMRAGADTVIDILKRAVEGEEHVLGTDHKEE